MAGHGEIGNTDLDIDEASREKWQETLEACGFCIDNLVAKLERARASTSSAAVRDDA